MPACSSMNIITLATQDQKTQGIIGIPTLPSKTLWVFPDMFPGAVFHSKGVLEGFEIYFLDALGNFIAAGWVEPPDALAKAPPGTKTVVEAKGGTFLSVGGGHGIEKILRDRLK